MDIIRIKHQDIIFGYILIPMDIIWVTELDINLDIHIWIQRGYLRINKDQDISDGYLFLVISQYHNLNLKRNPLITNPILSYPMLSFPVLSNPVGELPDEVVIEK